MPKQMDKLSETAWFLASTIYTRTAHNTKTTKYLISVQRRSNKNEQSQLQSDAINRTTASVS